MTTESAQTPLLLKEDPSKSSAPRPQIRLFGGQIILNPTISKANFFTFLLFTVYGTTVLLPVALLQSPLLLNHYSFSLKDQDKLNSIMTIFQIILHITLGPMLGILCDKHGRKPFLVMGILLQSVGTILLPNLPSVIPYFVIVHFVQVIGTMCMLSVPLLADYIDYETKGRVAGITSIITYTGSYFSQLLNSYTDLKKDLTTRFYQFGALGLVLGALLVLGLKGGHYHKKLFFDKKLESAKKEVGIESNEVEETHHEHPELAKDVKNNDDIEVNQAAIMVMRDNEGVILTRECSENINNEPTRITMQNNQLSLNAESVVENPQTQTVQEKNPAKTSMKIPKPTLKAGLAEAKNPWIATGFVVGFLMSAKFGLAGLNTINLVVYLTDETHINQYYALASKQSLAGLCCALFYGFFADKYNKFKIIIFVLLCAVIGDLLIILMPSPYGIMADLGMVFMGISSAGLMTMMHQLISKYATPRLRASVHAVSGIFSTFGTLSTSVIGLYLSQYNPRIPFFMFMACSVVGFVMLCWLYATKRKILNSNY